MPVVSSCSLTVKALDERRVRRQQHYTERYSISFLYQPAPPPPLPKPERQDAASPFAEWRAAAGLDQRGGKAGDAPGPAAPGEASALGGAVPPRGKLHDVLLGTTAVVLLSVLGGIGYAAWSGAVPGVVAPGGTAQKGPAVAAAIRPVVDPAAQAGARPLPDGVAAPPSAQDGTTDTLAPPPPAALPAPPPAAPDRLAFAASADKPVLAGPPPPASGSSAVVADIVPVRAPTLVTAEPVPGTKPSELDAAAPTPALPSASADATPRPASAPAPEWAAAASVPSARIAMPDATPPAPAGPAPTAEQAVAKAAPPAKPPEPDAALPAAAAQATTPVAEPSVAPATPPALPVKPSAPPPAVAVAAVRLPPPLDWTGATSSALANPPGSAASLASPNPPPSSEGAARPAAAAKASPPDTRQQMPLPTRDENLRSRMDAMALARAAQMKAWRQKLAEARVAAAAGADASGAQAGLPLSSAGEGGGLRAAAAMPQPVVRGIRVQKGSPDAAVLSTGPEQADQRLVMLGEQLPGLGRVIAILPRGGSWIVRTERGVIR